MPHFKNRTQRELIDQLPHSLTLFLFYPDGTQIHYQPLRMEVGGSSSRIGDKLWNKPKKIKLLCSDSYFNFLALSSIQKSWKKGKGKEGRKKTAYFDEGAIFTLGSLVKLLLLPTADVENPEGDDIRHHCSFCPGTAPRLLSPGSFSPSAPHST